MGARDQGLGYGASFRIGGRIGGGCDKLPIFTLFRLKTGKYGLKTTFFGDFGNLRGPNLRTARF